MSTAPLVDQVAPGAGWQQDLARLVERAALGDRTAFARFFDLTADRVYRVELLRARGCGDEAERAARDRYLTAWAVAGSFRTSGLSPLGWVLSLPVRPDPRTGA